MQPAATAPQRQVPWSAIAWFGALLLACYAPVLLRLANDWMIDDDMSHGFFVPAVALYIAWSERDRILSRDYAPSLIGVPVLILAAMQLIAATLGVELFLARTAFIVSLAGILLCAGGVPLLRALLFPLILLPFMVPLPSIIYNQITFPLQLLASSIAEHSLMALGIPVLRDGNILETANQRLSVIEACSGIRSLLSLSFLSLVYGYFFEKRTWMRWVLFLLTVPIALFANAFRVTMTGLIGEYDRALAEGALHTFEGWVVFVFSLLLLAAAHRAVSFIAARFRRHE